RSLARARSEIDAGAEEARLAAARREALEALLEQTRADLAARDADLDRASAALAETRDRLSEEEAARLADAAAAEALRQRLAGAQDEISAMSLALEAQRKKAEETLTLLAAAQAAQDGLNDRLADALARGQSLETQVSEQAAALAEAGEEVAAGEAALAAAQADLEAATQDEAALRDRLAAALAAQVAAERQGEAALSEAERQAALLKAARAALADAETARDRTAETAEDRAREVALLNAQAAELRSQLGSLRALLGAAEDRDEATQVEIEDLNRRLNTALARAASEERRRAELEEAERRRLEEEAQRLERYQSEFFGRLRDAIGDQQGVSIVGDRFVFDSEVLFDIGQADLSATGRTEIAKVAQLLQEVAAVIPPGIDWIIRVDGHTDATPIRSSRFRDNWELSQARALSVVRFMIEEYGFPPERLAATGFGEYQPVDPGDSAEARARNRRIELKLTER
ncbi:peptidoglycan -binding protein, partial [Mangrovicoccus algicola]